MFRGWQLSKADDGQVTAQLRDLGDADLMDGNVTVAVAYSTLNYKDGLALCNRSPVVRRWPLIPGIDLAGTVTASNHPAYNVGDAVLLNGWGVGEVHCGGLAQTARVNGDWLLPLPDTLSARQAMAIGTAGYTAMLCVLALEAHGLNPASGEVLVTGATGGVGSVATSLLASRGYRVVASTGKASEAAYLAELGASDVIDRALLSAPGKPMQKERWAAVVDSVGSHTLANALAATRYGGVVAACGLAQGMDLPASVAPFILRGVSLLGIDSVMAPVAKRQAAWAQLAQTLDRHKLDALTWEIPLADALTTATDLLAGKLRGRVVVNVNA